MIRNKSAAVLLLFFACGCHQRENKAVTTAPAADAPNIIYILADDMGYGDVSAYNPESKIHTPNIDGLAAEGMRFTDVHAPSSVCTPSRYGLLTGSIAGEAACPRACCQGTDGR